MRLEIDKSHQIWWISDNGELYICGNEMELAGINGISLAERHIYADGNVSYNQKAMFFFPPRSLYIRLQKLITRRKNDNNKNRGEKKRNN